MLQSPADAAVVLGVNAKAQRGAKTLGVDTAEVLTTDRKDGTTGLDAPLEDAFGFAYTVGTGRNDGNNGNECDVAKARSTPLACGSRAG
jgi:hypothetical protein